MIKPRNNFLVLLVLCMTGICLSACSDDEHHEGTEVLRITMESGTFTGRGETGTIVMPFKLSDKRLVPTSENLVFYVTSSWTPGGSAATGIEWTLLSVEPQQDQPGNWLATFTYRTNRQVVIEGVFTIRDKQVSAPAVTITLNP